MSFAGVFAPVPTPFDERDRVDTGKLTAALAQWLPRPIAGFVVLGSNGEAVFLDEVEADRVVVAARDAIPADRPLIVGTGRESTPAAMHAARRAAELGASAVLVRTPSFFKAQMTTDVLVRHYCEVADASPIPVLLYNVTMFTGVNMQPDAVERLARHPNIVGLKESGGDIGQIAEYVARTPDDFTVLAGSATTLYHALCAGCDGAVLALAMLCPDECVRMCQLIATGRHDDALRLQRHLLPIANSVGSLYGVAGLKAALDLKGYEGGFPRPPLRPAPQAVVDTITRQLEELAALIPEHART